MARSESKMPKIPQPLYEAFARRRVALFLGAGISIPGGGPTWEELVQPLISADIGVEEEDLKSLPLARIVSLYVIRGNRACLSDHLIEQLDKHQDISIHEKILQLPVNIILTTNYDKNLVEAARGSGIQYTEIDEDSKVINMSQDSLSIVNLYGTTATNQIATEEEVLQFDQERPVLSRLLEYVFLTHHVLFLGFSLRDDNVLNHILRVVRLLGDHKKARSDYAFMLNPARHEIDLWHERNLEIIGVEGVPEGEKSKIFEDFLDLLVASVQEITYISKERDKMVFREEHHYFYGCMHANRTPVMRRESTFSVFGLKPNARSDSSVKDRKKLYNEWLKKGEMRLILNLDENHIYKIRGYSVEEAEERLRRVKELINANLNRPNLIIAARKKMPRAKTYASLGEDRLVITNVPDVRNESEAYKESRVVSQQDAVNVFNTIFDRELMIMSEKKDSHASLNQKDIRYLKEKALQQVNTLLCRL